jgi:hypothetical protein
MRMKSVYTGSSAIHLFGCSEPLRLYRDDLVLDGHKADAQV